MNETNVLRRPLTALEMLDRCDQKMYLEADICVDLDDILYPDEDIDTTIAEYLTDTQDITNLSVSLVGCDVEKQELFLHVKGNVSSSISTRLDENEEDVEELCDELSTHLTKAANSTVAESITGTAFKSVYSDDELEKLIAAIEKLPAKELVKAYMQCKKLEGESNGTGTESNG